jgi:hypothetical protein
VKLLIFIFIFIGSTSLFARPSKFWVKFGKKRTSLKILGDGFISIKCNKKCEALKFMNQKDLQVSSRKQSKNPYAVKCKAMDGKVLIGKLYSGHSQSFCQAKDKSIVSTNIL